jgi:hypothetical protein
MSKRKRIKKADWRHHVYYGEEEAKHGGRDEAQMAGGYKLMVWPKIVKGDECYLWSVQGIGLPSGIGIGPTGSVVIYSRNSNTCGWEKTRIDAQRSALSAYRKYVQNKGLTT